MKNKTKAALVVVTIIMLLIGIFTAYYLSKDDESAFAASTNKYSVYYDYVVYEVYTSGSGATTTTLVTSGSNVKSANMPHLKGSTTPVSITMYGTSNNGVTQNFRSGSFIKSDVVNISVSSSFASGSIKIVSSLEPELNYASSSVSIGPLVEGMHSAIITLKGSGWNPDARSYAYYMAELSFDFAVDSLPPTLVSPNNVAGIGDSIMATDSGSGVNKLMIKTPGSSSYKNESNPYVFNENSLGGVYYYYASDQAGNNSATKSVLFDGEAPNIRLIFEGEEISGASPGPCQIMVEDESGVDLIRYRLNEANQWIMVENGFVLNEPGNYEIECIDFAGNSSTAQVIVDTEEPTITAYSGGNVINSEYASALPLVFSFSDDSGIAKAEIIRPGETEREIYYGEDLTECGLYKVYAQDLSGKTSYKNIILDYMPPELKIYAGNTELNLGALISSAIYANALDNNAFQIEHKMNGEEWADYTPNTVLLGEGLHYFRAYDICGNFSAVLSVKIDKTAPSLFAKRGEDEIANGAYCSSGVLLDGSDESGEIIINYMAPSSNEYSIYDGHLITEEGQHYYYALDRAGNSTAINSFILDATPPELIYFGLESTSEPFSVSALDNNLVALFVKGPSDDFFVSSGNEYMASDNSERGIYNFYCLDLAGNASSVLSIEFVSPPPEGLLFVSSNGGGAKLEYFGENLSATCDGAVYESGYLINTEGTHTILLNDANSGMQTEYTFELTHAYVLVGTHMPTCLEEGYSEYICVYCEDTIIADYVPSTGHNYLAIVSEASCVEEGKTIYICLNCNDTYETITSEIVSHSFGDWEVISDSSCDLCGIRARHCHNCGRIEEETIPPKGHSYEETIIAPSCLETGLTRYECFFCGDIVETDFIPATGHELISEKIEVTCTEKGCMRRSCIKCDYYYDADIVLPSGHINSVEVVRHASCLEEGIRKYTCSVCGFIEEAIIPAHGHNYIYASEFVEVGNTYIRYVCDVCGEEKTVNSGVQYEEIKESIFAIYEEYAPILFSVLGGAAGLWSVVLGIMYFMARKNDEREKAKKLIWTYILGLIGIAFIVMAVPLLISGIASWVTA